MSNSGEYQQFGYAGEAGTCLWCGRKLKRRSVFDHDATDRGHKDGTLPRGEYAYRPAGKLGNYQDDFFCGLRCGYQFGLRMAQTGKRLVKQAL